MRRREGELASGLLGMREAHALLLCYAYTPPHVGSFPAKNAPRDVRAPFDP